MIKKKGVLEVLDAALVKDARELGEILERMDRAFYEQSAQKKWGRPILYDDEFHVRQREAMRRSRENHGKV